VAVLTRGHRPIESLFDLLGYDEQAMTDSFGLALHGSSTLLNSFVASTSGGSFPSEPVEIGLQLFGSADRGFTDVEILASNLHMIVEAKRWWDPPSQEQLERYQGRFLEVRPPRATQRLVILTQDGTDAVVDHRLGGWRPVPPAQLSIVSWSMVASLASDASRRAPKSERVIAAEFARYIAEVAETPDRMSNQVFVVSLSTKPWATFPVSGVDVVRRHGVYFFPATGGPWPRQVPNYIAFRYHGELQSIHHVNDARVVDSGGELLPGYPDPWGHPHFLIELGPAMRPDHPVRTGPGIKRSRLVWADIDLLLTSNSITDAELNSRGRRLQD